MAFSAQAFSPIPAVGVARRCLQLPSGPLAPSLLGNWTDSLRPGAPVALIGAILERRARSAGRGAPHQLTALGYPPPCSSRLSAMSVTGSSMVERNQGDRAQRNQLVHLQDDEDGIPRCNRVREQKRRGRTPSQVRRDADPAGTPRPDDVEHLRDVRSRDESSARDPEPLRGHLGHLSPPRRGPRTV